MAGNRVAPATRNGGGGSQDEAALAHFAVGDGKLLACPDPAAPQDAIEIERAGPPALPAPLGSTAAMTVFDQLERCEEIWRGQLAL